VSHVHAHLIPRIEGGDPVPDQSPWQHPDPPSPMPANARAALIHAIALQLA
jgi:diadenosine tetraphosphate (Ap4A) HIT family hydrolase